MNLSDKTIRLLDYLCINGPTGITEMAKVTGISKGTIHRVLTSLKCAQWVSQIPETAKYTLGSKALEFGLRLISQIELRTISLPLLYQLRDMSGETATLSLRLGFERVYVEQVQSKMEVRSLMEIGRPYPLWIGSPGKAILAYMEENEIEIVIDDFIHSGFSVLASGKPLTVEWLRNQLTEIRKRGWAFSSSERVAATSGIAAPIFDLHEKVCGAIGITGPLPRFSSEVAVSYGEPLRQIARQIGLGMIGPSLNR